MTRNLLGRVQPSDGTRGTSTIWNGLRLMLLNGLFRQHSIVRLGTDCMLQEITRYKLCLVSCGTCSSDLRKHRYACLATLVPREEKCLYKAFVFLSTSRTPLIRLCLFQPTTLCSISWMDGLLAMRWALACVVCPAGGLPPHCSAMTHTCLWCGNLCPILCLLISWQDIALHKGSKFTLAPWQTRILPILVRYAGQMPRDQDRFRISVLLKSDDGSSTTVEIAIPVKHHDKLSVASLPVKSTYFFAGSMPTAFYAIPPRIFDQSRPPVLALRPYLFTGVFRGSDAGH
jgi:hypothetical protein